MDETFGNSGVCEYPPEFRTEVFDRTDSPASFNVRISSVQAKGGGGGKVIHNGFADSQRSSPRVFAVNHIGTMSIHKPAASRGGGGGTRGAAEEYAGSQYVGYDGNATLPGPRVPSTRQTSNSQNAVRGLSVTELEPQIALPTFDIPKATDQSLSTLYPVASETAAQEAGGTYLFQGSLLRPTGYGDPDLGGARRRGETTDLLGGGTESTTTAFPQIRSLTPLLFANQPLANGNVAAQFLKQAVAAKEEPKPGDPETRVWRAPGSMTSSMGAVRSANELFKKHVTDLSGYEISSVGELPRARRSPVMGRRRHRRRSTPTSLATTTLDTRLAVINAMPMGEKCWTDRNHPRNNGTMDMTGIRSGNLPRKMIERPRSQSLPRGPFQFMLAAPPGMPALTNGEEEGKRSKDHRRSKRRHRGRDDDASYGTTVGSFYDDSSSDSSSSNETQKYRNRYHHGRRGRYRKGGKPQHDLRRRHEIGFRPGMLAPVVEEPSTAMAAVASRSLLTCSQDFKKTFPNVYLGLCKGVIDVNTLVSNEIVVPIKEEIAIKRSAIRSRRAVTAAVSDHLWRCLQGKFPDPNIAPRLVRRIAEYFYDKVEYGIKDAEDERSFFQWLFRFDVENAIDLRVSTSIQTGANSVIVNVEGSAHMTRKKGDLFNLVTPDVVGLNIECVIKALFLNGGQLSQINQDQTFVHRVAQSENAIARQFLLLS